VTLSSSHSIS